MRMNHRILTAAFYIAMCSVRSGNRCPSCGNLVCLRCVRYHGGIAASAKWPIWAPTRDGGFFQEPRPAHEFC